MSKRKEIKTHRDEVCYLCNKPILAYHRMLSESPGPGKAARAYHVLCTDWGKKIFSGRQYPKKTETRGFNEKS